ncbi:O-methyltransferase [Micromonospora phaseoli]|uniref:O-methyltransferase n=1 Tax=Micromonospora phaseoli TaxID=1144548 RepID=A0A1H6YLX1_9ACTN|nr:methyltransferase [Micromonospora phaseoli]PZW00105.1 O-methyltransferase [Micromonospora phaseoli]GIJ79615.1 methyltransferase [Micromonospora phaseoli]SEJ38240.1 O-methyltransferase [Micromonospora phaseoli]
MLTRRRPGIDVPAILRLMEVGDYLLPYTIRAVCLLRVADRLADGPLPAAELARVCAAHEPSLTKALRYLATRDLFAEVTPGEFGLTPMADLLRTDHPYSARDIFLSPVVCTRAMEGLDHTLRTGEGAFDAVHGVGMWDHFGQHPGDGEAFDKVMSGVTGMELMAILRASDWSRFGTVVDVGGGNGRFLGDLLARFPRMRGVLFDLPGVVANAPETFAAAGVADRARVVPGSFLTDDIPTGGDAYVLKRILYSWSDEEATGVLRRIRTAMSPQGRVFILEAGRQSEADSTPLARRMDMLMLTLSAGGARSLDEQRALLAGAGLELVEATPTPMFPVIEARPA